MQETNTSVSKKTHLWIRKNEEGKSETRRQERKNCPTLLATHDIYNIKCIINKIAFRRNKIIQKEKTCSLNVEVLTHVCLCMWKEEKYKTEKPFKKHKLNDGRKTTTTKNNKIAISLDNLIYMHSFINNKY